MKKYFYITTPIYYPNATLHIGHAYTNILADVLSRYKRMQGIDVFFLTGSDEHGEKIAAKARENNLSPKEFVDPIIEKFKYLWNKLEITYDKFIRTTDSYHELTVSKVFSKLLEKKEIFLSKYVGLYCVQCESFFSKSQITEKKACPQCGNELKEIKEDSYFLELKSFSKEIKELIASGKFEIYPEKRKNELLKNFIEKGLEDLSVSRTSFDWGVKVVENPKHVIYVWIDALVNYISALGYLNSEKDLMNKFWNKDSQIVHIVGKEITRFHCIYWPAILTKLGLRLPDRVISHGWITLNDNVKISKSLGNIVDPLELIDKYGSDALRMYLISEIKLGNDGEYREELLVESFNSILANSIGNYASRVFQMILNYRNGIIPKTNKTNILNNSVVFNSKLQDYFVSYEEYMNSFEVDKAYDVAKTICFSLNKYIDITTPWLKNTDEHKEELDQILHDLVKGLLVMLTIYNPVIPNGVAKIAKQFNFDFEINYKNCNKDLSGHKISGKKEIIYQRIKQ